MGEGGQARPSVQESKRGEVLRLGRARGGVIEKSAQVKNAAERRASTSGVENLERTKSGKEKARRYATTTAHRGLAAKGKSESKRGGKQTFTI